MGKLGTFEEHIEVLNKIKTNSRSMLGIKVMLEDCLFNFYGRIARLLGASGPADSQIVTSQDVMEATRSEVLNKIKITALYQYYIHRKFLGGSCGNSDLLCLSTNNLVSGALDLDPIDLHHDQKCRSLFCPLCCLETANKLAKVIQIYKATNSLDSLTITSEIVSNPMKVSKSGESAFRVKARKRPGLLYTWFSYRAVEDLPGGLVTAYCLYDKPESLFKDKSSIDSNLTYAVRHPEARILNFKYEGYGSVPWDQITLSGYNILMESVMHTPCLIGYRPKYIEDDYDFIQKLDSEFNSKPLETKKFKQLLAITRDKTIKKTRKPSKGKP